MIGAPGDTAPTSISAGGSITNLCGAPSPSPPHTLPSPSKSRDRNHATTGLPGHRLWYAPPLADLLGYARVSTGEQRPDLQLDALRAARCSRVWTHVASGASLDRPQLAAALDHLRPGDTLVVWKLDRLGRSLRHLVGTVGDLGRHGIGFESLQESLDTTTPGGRLVFHLFGALAEFERDLIRERTRAGLAAARARGRAGGRRSVMTPEKLAVARQLLAAGRSPAVVAATIGVGRTTVYRHTLGRP